MSCDCEKNEHKQTTDEQKQQDIANTRLLLELERLDARYANILGEMTRGRRKSCIECVEKHVGAAMILFDEIAAGYPTHRLRVIGHLSEAADEAQEFFEIYEMLLLSRRNFQREGVAPDWERIAGTIAAAKAIDK